MYCEGVQFSVFLKVKTRKTFRVLETLASLFNLQLAGGNAGISDFKIISSDNFLNFQKFLLLLGELQFLRPKDKIFGVKKFKNSTDLALLNEVLKEELLFVPRKLGSRFGRKKLPLGYAKNRLPAGRRVLLKKKKLIQIQFMFFKMGKNFVSASFFYRNFESFLNNRGITSVPLGLNLIMLHKHLLECVSWSGVLLRVFSYIKKLGANY